MKDRIRGLIIMICLSIIAVGLLWSSLETRLVVKQMIHMGFTNEEVSQSRLYHTYNAIALGESQEAVESQLKLKHHKDDLGLLTVYDGHYGQIKTFYDDGSLVVKMIVVPLKSIKGVNHETTLALNGYSTKEDVFELLPDTLVYGSRLTDEGKIETQYVWQLDTGERLKIGFVEETVYDIDFLGSID